MSNMDNLWCYPTFSNQHISSGPSWTVNLNCFPPDTHPKYQPINHNTCSGYQPKNNYQNTYSGHQPNNYQSTNYGYQSNINPKTHSIYHTNSHHNISTGFQTQSYQDNQPRSFRNNLQGYQPSYRPEPSDIFDTDIKEIQQRMANQEQRRFEFKADIMQEIHERRQENMALAQELNLFEDFVGHPDFLEEVNRLRLMRLRLVKIRSDRNDKRLALRSETQSLKPVGSLPKKTSPKASERLSELEQTGFGTPLSNSTPIPFGVSNKDVYDRVGKLEAEIKTFLEDITQDLSPRSRASTERRSSKYFDSHDYKPNHYRQTKREIIRSYLSGRPERKQKQKYEIEPYIENRNRPFNSQVEGKQQPCHNKVDPILKQHISVPSQTKTFLEESKTDLVEYIQRGINMNNQIHEKQKENSDSSSGVNTDTNVDVFECIQDENQDEKSCEQSDNMDTSSDTNTNTNSARNEDLSECMLVLARPKCSSSGTILHFEVDEDVSEVTSVTKLQNYGNVPQYKPTPDGNIPVKIVPSQKQRSNNSQSHSNSTNNIQIQDALASVSRSSSYESHQEKTKNGCTKLSNMPAREKKSRVVPKLNLHSDLSNSDVNGAKSLESLPERRKTSNTEHVSGAHSMDAKETKKGDNHLYIPFCLVSSILGSEGVSNLGLPQEVDIGNNKLYIPFKLLSSDQIKFEGLSSQASSQSGAEDQITYLDYNEETQEFQVRHGSPWNDGDSRFSELHVTNTKGGDGPTLDLSGISSPSEIIDRIYEGTVACFFPDRSSGEYKFTTLYRCGQGDTRKDLAKDWSDIELTDTREDLLGNHRFDVPFKLVSNDQPRPIDVPRLDMLGIVSKSDIDVAKINENMLSQSVSDGEEQTSNDADSIQAQSTTSFDQECQNWAPAEVNVDLSAGGHVEIHNQRIQNQFDAEGNIPCHTVACYVPGDDLEDHNVQVYGVGSPSGKEPKVQTSPVNNGQCENVSGSGVFASASDEEVALINQGSSPTLFLSEEIATFDKNIVNTKKTNGQSTQLLYPQPTRTRQKAASNGLRTVKTKSVMFGEAKTLISSKDNDGDGSDNNIVKAGEDTGTSAECGAFPNESENHADKKVAEKADSEKIRQRPTNHRESTEILPTAELNREAGCNIQDFSDNGSSSNTYIALKNSTKPATEMVAMGSSTAEADRKSSEKGWKKTVNSDVDSDSDFHDISCITNVTNAKPVVDPDVTQKPVSGKAKTRHVLDKDLGSKESCAKLDIDPSISQKPGSRKEKTQNVLDQSQADVRGQTIKIKTGEQAPSVNGKKDSTTEVIEKPVSNKSPKQMLNGGKSVIDHEKESKLEKKAYPPDSKVKNRAKWVEASGTESDNISCLDLDEDDQKHNRTKEIIQKGSSDDNLLDKTDSWKPMQKKPSTKQIKSENTKLFMAPAASKSDSSEDNSSNSGTKVQAFVYDGSSSDDPLSKKEFNKSMTRKNTNSPVEIKVKGNADSEKSKSRKEKDSPGSKAKNKAKKVGVSDEESDKISCLDLGKDRAEHPKTKGSMRNGLSAEDIVKKSANSKKSVEEKLCTKQLKSESEKTKLSMAPGSASDSSGDNSSQPGTKVQAFVYDGSSSDDLVSKNVLSKPVTGKKADSLEQKVKSKVKKVGVSDSESDNIPCLYLDGDDQEHQRKKGLMKNGLSDDGPVKKTDTRKSARGKLSTKQIRDENTKLSMAPASSNSDSSSDNSSKNGTKVQAFVYEGSSSDDLVSQNILNKFVNGKKAHSQESKVKSKVKKVGVSDAESDNVSCLDLSGDDQKHNTTKGTGFLITGSSSDDPVRKKDSRKSGPDKLSRKNTKDEKTELFMAPTTSKSDSNTDNSTNSKSGTKVQAFVYAGSSSDDLLPQNVLKKSVPEKRIDSHGSNANYKTEKVAVTENESETQGSGDDAMTSGDSPVKKTKPRKSESEQNSTKQLKNENTMFEGSMTSKSDSSGDDSSKSGTKVQACVYDGSSSDNWPSQNVPGKSVAGKKTPEKTINSKSKNVGISDTESDSISSRDADRASQEQSKTKGLDNPIRNTDSRKPPQGKKAAKMLKNEKPKLSMAPSTSTSVSSSDDNSSKCGTKVQTLVYDGSSSDNLPSKNALKKSVTGKKAVSLDSKIKSTSKIGTSDSESDHISCLDWDGDGQGHQRTKDDCSSSVNSVKQKDSKKAVGGKITAIQKSGNTKFFAPTASESDSTGDISCKSGTKVQAFVYDGSSSDDRPSQNTLRKSVTEKKAESFDPRDKNDKRIGKSDSESDNISCLDSSGDQQEHQKTKDDCTSGDVLVQKIATKETVGRKISAKRKESGNTKVVAPTASKSESSDDNSSMGGTKVQAFVYDGPSSDDRLPQKVTMKSFAGKTSPVELASDSKFYDGISLDTSDTDQSRCRIKGNSSSGETSSVKPRKNFNGETETDIKLLKPKDEAISEEDSDMSHIHMEGDMSMTGTGYVKVSSNNSPQLKSSTLAGDGDCPTEDQSLDQLPISHAEGKQSTTSKSENVGPPPTNVSDTVTKKSASRNEAKTQEADKKKGKSFLGSIKRTLKMGNVRRKQKDGKPTPTSTASTSKKKSKKSKNKKSSDCSSDEEDVKGSWFSKIGSVQNRISFPNVVEGSSRMTSLFCPEEEDNEIADTTRGAETSAQVTTFQNEAKFTEGDKSPDIKSDSDSELSCIDLDDTPVTTSAKAVVAKPAHTKQSVDITGTSFGNTVKAAGTSVPQGTAESRKSTPVQPRMTEPRESLQGQPRTAGARTLPPPDHKAHTIESVNEISSSTRLDQDSDLSHFDLENTEVNFVQSIPTQSKQSHGGTSNTFGNTTGKGVSTTTPQRPMESRRSPPAERVMHTPMKGPAIQFSTGIVSDPDSDLSCIDLGECSSTNVGIKTSNPVMNIVSPSTSNTRKAMASNDINVGSVSMQTGIPDSDRISPVVERDIHIMKTKSHFGSPQNVFTDSNSDDLGLATTKERKNNAEMKSISSKPLETQNREPRTVYPKIDMFTASSFLPGGSQAASINPTSKPVEGNKSRGDSDSSDDSMASLTTKPQVKKSRGKLKNAASKFLSNITTKLKKTKAKAGQPDEAVQEPQLMSSDCRRSPPADMVMHKPMAALSPPSDSNSDLSCIDLDQSNNNVNCSTRECISKERQKFGRISYSNVPCVTFLSNTYLSSTHGMFPPYLLTNQNLSDKCPDNGNRTQQRQCLHRRFGVA